MLKGLRLVTSQLCRRARFLGMVIQGLSDKQRKAYIVPALRQYSTLYRQVCQRATKAETVVGQPYAPSEMVNGEGSPIWITLGVWFVSALHDNRCLLILLG